jgi:hypothetical protein
MSQVVVTEDNLKARRLKSGDQEKNIDREGLFNKWRRSDITGFDPIAALVGVAALPVLVSWYIIGTIVKVAIFAAIAVSRAVGALIGRNTKLS